MKIRGTGSKAISGIPPGHQPITVVDEVQVSVSLDPWLSLRALSGYSGLSVRKLRYLLADPQRPLPVYRVDGKILVRQSDFDRWMAACKATSPLDAIVDEVIRGFHQTTPRR